MTYASIIQDLPQELQLTMLKLVEALEQDLRQQLAVRREDFDALRSEVHALAEAQRRTEQRVEELAEAQRRTEQRVEELAEAQQRTEQRVEELAEAQRRTEEEIRKLVEAQIRFEEQMRKFEIRQDKLIGYELESKYRNKAHAYFGRVLRKVRAISFQEIEEDLEKLPDYERNDLLLLDLLVRGYPRARPDAPEV